MGIPTVFDTSPTYTGTVTSGDLEVDSGTLSVDATNNRVGIGDTAPGTQVQVKSTAPYLTLQNSTAENTDGGCESKLIFEDHANAALVTVIAAHSGSSDDTKGKLILKTHTGSSVTTALTINETQQVTVGEGKLVLGSTAVSSTAAELNVLDGLNRGHIIVGNASGAPASLAEGSENQVLTINGSGDAVWAAASGGGAAADDLDHILHQQVFS